MSKKLLIILFFSVAGAVGVVLILFNVFGNDINPETKINYCDRNPDSLICVVSDPSELEIAEDLFMTVIVQFSSMYNEEFCVDYFSGNVVTYCSENNIMPSSTYLLSTELIIEEHDEGVFNITSKYRTENPAYMFRVGIDSIDGVYKITGLSYYEIDPNEDLYLLDVQIEDIMIDIISLSDDGLEDYCETYFVDDALTTCETDVLSVVPLPNIDVLVDIVETDTNSFEYITETDDELTRYKFTITFSMINNEYYISDIEFEEEIIE